MKSWACTCDPNGIIYATWGDGGGFGGTDREGQGNRSLPCPVLSTCNLLPNANAPKAAVVGARVTTLATQKGTPIGSVRPLKPATSAADKARL